MQYLIYVKVLVQDLSLILLPGPSALPAIFGPMNFTRHELIRQSTEYFVIYSSKWPY